MTFGSHARPDWLGFVGAREPCTGAGSQPDDERKKRRA